MNTIRKFGLEHCDLPTMLWNVTVLWRTLTLNIDKQYTKRIPFIFYILATIISASCFYAYLMSMIWFVFVRCRETGDLLSATIAFSIGAASLIGTTKLIFMYVYREKLRDLVEEYLKCNSASVLKSRFDGNIQKTLRIVKKRAVTFWLVLIVNGILYNSKPFIQPGRHLMEDSFIYYGLEPMYETPNYEIAKCLTIFAVFFTVYVPATITTLLIVIVGYSEAQILALSKELKYVWKDAEKYAKTIIIKGLGHKKIIINEYVERDLVEIVKIQNVVINLVRKTENIFRGAIAMEFLLLTVAIVADLLGGLENTFLEMPFSLMQVGMDCLVGQKIIDASLVFENAVYDSKWENFNCANMKTILMMLHNSQKTLTLSAGGVTMLSFTSLMTITKSIYSTYTTLRSTVK